MGPRQDNLILFGLDLRNVGKWLALAVNQLLFDHSSWLAKRFQPPFWVLHEDEWYRSHVGRLSRAELTVDGCGVEFYGISIPEELVLFKQIKLPLSSEVFLSDAVALEVDGGSPFPAEDLVFGSCILSRDDPALVVLIAMTTKQAVADAQARWIESGPAKTGESAAEVCAVFGNQQLVELRECVDPAKKSAYEEVLRHLAWRSIAAMAIAFVLLAVPAGSSVFRANRLAGDYSELRQTSQSVDQSVEKLHMQRAVITTVREAVESRLDYAFWLNHVARITPDDTQLQQLSIEGNAVQVLGYSDNAANYLRLLTEEPAYSEVRARSAFVRDSRSGKERFQVDWSLVQGAL